jgi:peroxiredoxin Q/BCP
MKQFLGKSFLGIVRSTFLIGPDGRIAKIWDKAPSKGHAVEVLEAVKQLAAGPVH